MDGDIGPLHRVVSLSAILLAIGATQRVGADSPGQAPSPVPSDWRTGIATFYGGAPDKMVCLPPNSLMATHKL